MTGKFFARNKGFKLFLLVSLFGFMSACYAVPFIIVPAGPLPQFIPPGGSALAAYTVSNNTGSQRNNNSVTYLPPNVSIINSGCTKNFNLAPRGQPGSSCTLFLRVSGAVSATDPNPHNHLFVCFPGNMTCAGTNYSLNVSTSSNLQQTAYVANDNGGNTISICPVLAGGGGFGTCVSHVDATFSSPVDVAVNNTATFAYVANTNGTISVCPIASNGSLGACSAIAAPDSLFTGLRINATNTVLYYTENTAGLVAACPINANGSLGACVPQPQNFSSPVGRISLKGSLAYIASSNIVTGDTVTVCTVNPNGSFAGCGSAFADPSFSSGPTGTEIDPSNSYLYVANFNSTISICPINANGTLSACAVSNGNGTFAFGNATNSFTQNVNGVSYIYVPNGGAFSTTVSICPILSGGSFGTCTLNPSATFEEPTGVAIATFGQF